MLFFLPNQCVGAVDIHFPSVAQYLLPLDRIFDVLEEDFLVPLDGLVDGIDNQENLVAPTIDTFSSQELWPVFYSLSM